MKSLKPNTYYHIYNRGNNREKLFYSAANYEYFLEKYQHHCSHVFDTYAFCLMSNHFHFLVRVRPEKEQSSLFSDKFGTSKKMHLPSRYLANFFNGYAQAINRQEGRTGSLFQKPFKRKEVESEEYFRELIIYIHLNPVKHGFTDLMNDYPFSSFQVYLNSDDSFINRLKVLTLFGGIENFIEAHKRKITLN